MWLVDLNGHLEVFFSGLYEPIAIITCAVLSLPSHHESYCLEQVKKYGEVAPVIFVIPFNAVGKGDFYTASLASYEPYYLPACEYIVGERQVILARYCESDLMFEDLLIGFW